MWYLDADGDGYSDGTTAIQCGDPGADYYLAGDLTATSGDCDDTNILINPTTVRYLDADGDGQSDGTTLNQCTRATNYYLTGELANGTSGDCDDGDALNYSGNTEICDGQDNDCDTIVDNGVQTTYYADSDGDGYGDSAVSTGACTPPVGYTGDNADCLDSDGTVYP